MNTDGKKCLRALTQAELEHINQILSGLNSELQNQFAVLADAISHEQVRYLVEDVYSLGKLRDVYEIFGGYINRSFGAVVEKDGKQQDYFVRKYKLGATDADVKVEHDLIRYAVEHGMTEISNVYLTPQGKTSCHMTEVIDGKITDRIFAIYQFLPGEDRYTWIDTNMTPQEDMSYGEMLASFHSCVNGFDPGLKAEPPIVTLLHDFQSSFPHKCDGLSDNNQFKKLWEENLDLMLSTCRSEEAFFNRPDMKALPVCACHCDFHPGNVKWEKDRCTSVFDLDWSKLDKRLYDVALGTLYACSSWNSADNGALHLERIRNVLQGYDCRLRDGGISRFTDEEIEAFPHMMTAAAVYLLNWSSSYCDDAAAMNEYEYFYYLSHCLNALDQTRQHAQELSDIMRTVRES